MDILDKSWPDPCPVHGWDTLAYESGHLRVLETDVDTGAEELFEGAFLLHMVLRHFF